MKKRTILALLLSIVLGLLCIGCGQEEQLFRIEDQNTGLIGYANQRGKIVIECQYDGYDTIRDDTQYMVVEKEEQYMLIDKAGNVIFTVDGPLTYYPKTNLCDMMDRDMMYVVLDTEGNQKIPGQFELVYMIDQSHVCVKQNGEVFMCDLETNEQRKLIEGKTVRNIWASDQLIAYTEGEFDDRLNRWTEKWGVVDMQGNEILPPTYDEMIGYSENRAFGYFTEGRSVWSTEMHLLNEKGEVIKVFEGAYDPYLLQQPFENGRAAIVQQGVGWGANDEEGNWVLDPAEEEYNFTYLRIEEEVIHGITYGDRHVFYDLNGKKLFDSYVEEAKYTNGYIAFSDEEKGSGLMNLSGKIVTRFPEGYMWTN